MGTVILLIALLVEIGFAAYCFLTHSRQVQVRSYLWIAAFGAFVLFTLASIIRWSFRWYLLALLLLVWVWLLLLLASAHLLKLGLWALGSRAQEFAFRVGLAMVLSLMIFSTYNDVARLIQKLTGAGS